METQALLPLLVDVGPAVVRVRPEKLEDTILRQLSASSGLPMADIARRCLRVAGTQARREGNCDFLMPELALRKPRGRYGRKPRHARKAELEKSIAASLRALERDRAALAAITGSPEVTEFRKEQRG